MLPKGASRQQRLKALNKGNKKQRKLLIHLIHYALSSQLPMRRLDFHLIERKLRFLNSHFQNEEDMRRLVSSSDKEQKDVLGSIPSFYGFLYTLFRN